MGRKKTLSLAISITLILCIQAQIERLQVRDEGAQLVVYSDELRFVVNKSPFYLQIYENTTRELLYSTQNSTLQLAKWTGVSLQQKIYEGYSFRVGTIYARANAGDVLFYSQIKTTNVIFGINLESEDNIYLELEICDVEQRRLTLKLSSVNDQSIQQEQSLSEQEYNRVIWGFDSEESEGLYGFGERFVPQQNRKNSRFYEWVEDGGFGFGLDVRLPKGKFSTYVPMPFTLSSKGYGLYLNTTYRSDWDIGSTSVAFTTETNSTWINLYFGGYPADSLVYYVVEVGKTLIPPPFQFGLWEQFSEELRNASVEAWPHDRGVTAWRRFIELDIPASVAKIELHFLPKGSQIGSESYWRDVNQAYAELGIVTTAYFNPTIAQSYSALYDEAFEKDLFVHAADGEIALFYYKGAGPVPFLVSMLDFSNERTGEFWSNQLQASLDLGFRGWMQDYGEYVDPYQRFANGWRGEQMHNEYPNLYHEASFNFFKNLSDPKRFARGYAPEYLYYVRSGYSKTQHNVWATWTGDPCSDFSRYCGLPAQLSAMLSVGLSGLAYTGSDTGGFVWLRPPSLTLQVRWLQLSSVSAIMEIDGGGTSILGAEKSHLFQWGDGVTSLRYLSKWRMQLFPYLYTLAHVTNDVCLPLMRHHLLTFPRDQEAVRQNYQYMLGDALLVAPVVLSETQSTQAVYLPAPHDWYDLTNNVLFAQNDGRFMIKWAKYHSSGGYAEVAAALINTLPPLFVRAGTILALQDPSVDTFWNTTNKTVVSQADRAHIQHYWAVPKNDSGIAFGRTYDGANCNTQYVRAKAYQQFVWNASDTLNRMYTAQLLLPRFKPTQQNFIIIDNLGRQVQKTQDFEEIVDSNISLWKSDLWRYYFNETTAILWLRYTGCTKEQELKQKACRSFVTVELE